MAPPQQTMQITTGHRGLSTGHQRTTKHCLSTFTVRMSATRPPIRQRRTMHARTTTRALTRRWPRPPPNRRADGDAGHALPVAR